MKYRDISALKYEVVAKEVFLTNIQWQGPSIEIRDPITGALAVEIHPAGWVVVYPGYMWDGASGPTFDGTVNIGPSLLHDALYETLRGIGEKCFTRKQADEAMYRELKANVNKAKRRDLAKAKNKAARALAITKWSFQHARYATWYKGLRWFAFYAARKRKLEDKYIVREAM